MGVVKRIFAVLLFLLSLSVAAGAARLAAYALEAKPLVPDEGPGGLTETVTGFFDALCAEDWETAYACLSNYSSLGLEDTPEDPTAAKFWQAQKDAWAFEVHPGYEVDGTSVTKGVTLRCLDLGGLTAGLGDAVQARLARDVEEARLRSEVYDESGAYRQELVMEALDASVDEALTHAPEHLFTRELTVHLRYLDGAWKIDAGTDLLSALTGGTFR